MKYSPLHCIFPTDSDGALGVVLVGVKVGVLGVEINSISNYERGYSNWNKMKTGE